MGKKPQRSETIIERHDHHSTLRQHFGTGSGRRAGPDSECAAVDPDHDRKPLTVRFGWRPDVESQTVLAGGDAFRRRGGLATSARGKIPRLGALRPEPSSIANRRPRFG